MIILDYKILQLYILGIYKKMVELCIVKSKVQDRRSLKANS